MSISATPAVRRALRIPGENWPESRACIDATMDGWAADYIREASKIFSRPAVGTWSRVLLVPAFVRPPCRWWPLMTMVGFGPTHRLRTQPWGHRRNEPWMGEAANYVREASKIFSRPAVGTWSAGVACASVRQAAVPVVASHDDGWFWPNSNTARACSQKNK